MLLFGMTRTELEARKRIRHIVAQSVRIPDILTCN